MLTLLFAAHIWLALPGGHSLEHHTDARFSTWQDCMDYAAEFAAGRQIRMALCEPWTVGGE